MPNTPTIPNFPPQGIQAQLDLLYLYNPDAANKLIAQLEAGIVEIKQVQEEVEKALQDLQGVMRYKGSVQTEADLPTEGNVVGDIWNIISTDENVAWTGTEWDKFGSTIDTSKFLTNNTTSADALAVGKNSSASIGGTAVGPDANAQASAVVIGWGATGHGVSIGPNTTSAVDAVQLGEGKNPDAGTFKVGLGQNYELIDSTGHIPLAMLPDLSGVVGAVDSVNGKTGVVVLSGDDISGDVNGRAGTINDLLSGYETKKFSIPYSGQFSIVTLKIGTFKKSDAATVFTVTTEYVARSTEVVSCYLSVDANRIRFYADMFSEYNQINATSIYNAIVVPMYVDNGDYLDIYVRTICSSGLDNINVTVTHDKKLSVADDLAPDFSGGYPSGYIVASGSVHMSIGEMRQAFVASQFYAWPSFTGSAFVPFRRDAGSSDMPNSHAFTGVAIPHAYNEFGMVAIDIEDKKLYLYSGKGTEVTPAGWVEVGSAAGGLASVSHDDTLTGDGTSESPLSVVGGGDATSVIIRRW